MTTARPVSLNGMTKSSQADPQKLTIEELCMAVSQRRDESHGREIKAFAVRRSDRVVDVLVEGRLDLGTWRAIPVREILLDHCVDFAGNYDSIGDTETGRLCVRPRRHHYDKAGTHDGAEQHMPVERSSANQYFHAKLDDESLGWLNHRSAFGRSGRTTRMGGPPATICGAFTSRTSGAGAQQRTRHSRGRARRGDQRRT
jgi:hypothetical protein